MGENSKIAWTDATFNPWMGCTKISPGCAHCYAERENVRYGRRLWGRDAPRQRTSATYWRQPLKWNAEAEKARVRKRVFCGSWCDVMEAGAYLDTIRKDLYALIERTPNLDWLLLTKRPENFLTLLPPAWLQNPRPNVWGMTTMEDDDYLWRAQKLCQVPFVIRGLSVEPMLGPVDIRPVNGCIEWVIVGGESGSDARPCNVAWIRSVVEQCAAARVACFVKQLGENAVDQLGRMRGAMYSAADHKGALLESMPPDLRVRQMPEVRRGH